MGAALGPVHLLLLDHAFAHQVIDGRFHKRRGDRFLIAIAVPIVRDERLIGRNIPSEFANCFQ